MVARMRPSGDSFAPSVRRPNGLRDARRFDDDFDGELRVRLFRRSKTLRCRFLAQRLHCFFFAVVDLEDCEQFGHLQQITHPLRQS